MTLAEEFHSRICPNCHAAKGDGKSFCLTCYLALPLDLRHNLWRKFGAGYAEAVAAAKEFLKALPVMPGKEG